MHAMGASRALLAGLVCVAVGCSSKAPEETSGVHSASSPLVVGWEGTGAMAETRKYHAGVVLQSGKVLVVGGSRGSAYLSSATVYEPGTGTWAVVAPMPEGRHAHTATVLGTGKVLVAGGENAAGRLSSARVYDAVTNTWASAGTFASGVARDSMTATLLQSGKVLVAGGGNIGGSHNKVDVYDPVAGNWSVGANMRALRRNHTATRLQSGQVLVVGGRESGVLAAAEVYNPLSNTWTVTGALATARYDHTATLLPSGKVLVVGGRNSGGVVGTAELYDPGTGMWSVTSAPGSARELHTATLLSTGKVLVAGGQNGSTLGSAEVYDPGTGQWSATAGMVGARYLHVAVLLEPQGKVLVVGGLVVRPPPVGTVGLATAELYAYDACAGVVCNNSPGACYEAAGTCGNGVCSYAPKAAGATCDDSNACTGEDACNGAGACAGNAMSCSSPPGQCYEEAGTCSNGACDYEYKAAGAGCDDGDECTVGEVCNGAGGCAGTPVTCTSPPGQCYEAAGTCSGGACSYAPKAAGSACDDGEAGTINDVCSGAGVCAGVVACTTPPSACHDSPGTWANGACTYPFKAAGTLCDDATACTTGDVCNGLGTCGGAAVVCNSPPNSCYRAAGVCDSGTCSYTPEAAGVACASDSDACTQDVCDGAGACAHPLAPAGTSCGPGRICDATGQCPIGCWIAGAYYAAGAANPAGECQQCNPSVSTSSWSFKPAATECRASGGVCDVAEYCTGNTATCPADVKQPSTTVCRASAGTCDVAETCTGSSAACPANTLSAAGTLCRGAASACDAAEYCNGAIATCPGDGPAANGTSCGAPSTGTWSSCNADACGGSGTESRSVTEYACMSGACGAVPSTETRSCTTPTVPCPSPSYGSWGSCSANACGGWGTESRSVTEYVCSGGGCQPSIGTQTRGCEMPQVPCPPTQYGAWFCSAPACGGPGTQSRSVTEYSCSGGGCQPSTWTQTETCDRPPVPCPPTQHGAWSSCSANACGGWGTWSRSVTEYACSGGGCQPSTWTQTEGCYTPEVSCPPTQYGAWSSCSVSACGGWGSQSRSVTEYACSGGGCQPSTWTQTQECLTPPVSCPPTFGPWSSCSADTCGGSGTQLRYVTEYVCSGGGCQPSFGWIDSQQCSIPTVPCPPTSYGAWSPCDANACGGSGTQSRDVTQYACSGGTCQPSPSRESQSCTTPTVSCPPDTESWSACNYSSICDETATQDRTVTSYNCASGQCLSSIRTDTYTCSRNTNGTTCGPNWKFQCLDGECEYMP